MKMKSILEKSNIYKMNAEIFQEIQKNNEEQSEILNKFYYNRECPKNPEILKLLKITEEDAKDVKCFDSKGVLELYHFTNHLNEKVNHIRGIIIDIEKNAVVCKSFPFTPEYTTEFLNIIKLTDEHIQKAIVSTSYEGTVVRVFYHDQEGFCFSTHRKINGRGSIWNSRQFIELFKECLNIEDENDFFSTLNKNCCYVFLIRHPENSLVCRNKKPMLYHLATYESNEMSLGYTIPEENTAQQAFPKLQFQGVNYTEDPLVNTVEELVNYVNNFDPRSYNGITLSFSTGHMIKIVSNEYYIKRQLIGNQPNVRTRYLQLKKLNISYETLVAYLPQYRKVYKNIETSITKLKAILTNCYKSRYIYRQFKELPTKQHWFIKNLNSEPEMQNLTVKENNFIRQTIEKRINELEVRELEQLLDELK